MLKSSFTNHVKAATFLLVNPQCFSLKWCEIPTRNGRTTDLSRSVQEANIHGLRCREFEADLRLGERLMGGEPIRVKLTKTISFCRRWGWFGWVEADFSPIDEDLADAGFALKGFHGMIRMDLGLSKTWIDQQNVVQRSTIWMLICQFIWNIIYPDIGWFHSTWRWYLWISLYWGFGDGNFNHQPDDSATVRTVHQSPNSADNLLIQIQKPLDV